MQSKSQAFFRVCFGNIATNVLGFGSKEPCMQGQNQDYRIGGGFKLEKTILIVSDCVSCMMCISGGGGMWC